MLLTVCIGGAAFLLGIAVALGVDQARQHAAWDELGTGRRKLARGRRDLAEVAQALAEERRELWEWEGQLIEASECGGCPVCELRRRRRERPAS